MRSGWIRGLFLAVALAGASGTALAAKPPEGSYRESCTREYIRGNVLHARCEYGRRHRAWTRLDNVSSCIGDIANYQGRLICLRKRDLPDGDWKDSCIKPHLSAPGVFAAVCKSLRGGWIASEIALDKCRIGLTNAKGHLGCKKVEASDQPTAAAPAVSAKPSTPPAPAAAVPPAPPPAAREAPPAPAQADDSTAPPAITQDLPPGSYGLLCRNFEFDGRYLSGECRDKRGQYQETSLDTKSCARDQQIGSRDGDLVCMRLEGREVPAGSYSKSCRDLSFDGRFLQGQCLNLKGGWDVAVLDTRTCKNSDEKLNVDGELICRGPQPATAPAPPVPPAQSATATAPTAGAPPASALVPAPAAPAASIPPAPSAAPVPAPPPPPPPAAPAPAEATAGSIGNAAPTGGTISAPSGQVSITLYSAAGFSGPSKTLNGDTPDLAPLGWNELAASVQVRGAWEVCEEPNFGGRCARISEDEPDLADIGFNGRISSVRQLKAASR